MNNHENKRKVTTSVTTTTETQPVSDQRELGVLNPEEERVLRMLHGLSEQDSHELKFALGADEELRTRLALLEHYLMELFKSETLDENLMDQVRALKEAVVTN